MSNFKKFQAFVAVLCVFLIILATNLIDKQNFLRVEQSVENIYNNRLVAKELLHDVSTAFHKKEMAYALNDTAYLKAQNNTINIKIGELLAKFDRTNATQEEEKILDEIGENHEKLIQLEKQTRPSEISYLNDCAGLFADIKENIDELSAEQIVQGKSQKMNARGAVSTAKLFSKIEIYMLIFLALVMQVLILYSPKKKGDQTKDYLG